MFCEPILSFSPLSHRCWKIPQGSAEWLWPPSLRSATLPPTPQLSPPHITCRHTCLTLTSSPTLTLSILPSAPGSCLPISTTNTTFPPCTAIQVLVLTEHRPSAKTKKKAEKKTKSDFDIELKFSYEYASHNLHGTKFNMKYFLCSSSLQKSSQFMGCQTSSGGRIHTVSHNLKS